MSSSPAALSALTRTLYRELRRSGGPVRSGQIWQYVMAEARKGSPSEEDRMRRMKLLGGYVDYVRSSREHRELLSRYQGKGERSTEESARLVGLKLPENPF